MMATIFNSSILNSATLESAILHKTLTQTSSIWLKLIHSDSTWWWQPSWILLSWILPFCTKKNFSSFWLNHEAAILDSAILHKTLTQTTSIWLKPNSDSTWWYQPSWILPCWIQTLPSWIQTPCYHWKTSLSLWFTHLMMATSWILPSILDSAILHKTLTQTQTNSFWSTWWWQPSWILDCHFGAILNSAILDSDTAILDSDTLLSSLRFPLKNTLTPFWLWLKLIQSHSNSFILTQIDDCRNLEFCYLWFSHFAQKKLHLFFLTQLDDGSHLEFCHIGFRHCHLGFRHLGIFCQIHSKNTLTPFWLWLKLIQSDSNSFILT